MLALAWIALDQVAKLVFVHVRVVELSLVLVVIGLDLLGHRILGDSSRVDVGQHARIVLLFVFLLLQITFVQKIISSKHILFPGRL